MTRAQRPPRVAVAVFRFAAAGVVALLVLGVTSGTVLRRIGTNEAVRDARMLAEVEARTVVQPSLTTGVVSGDSAAIASLDHVVRERLVRDPVVRVKLWRPDGTIIYSDDRRLVGSKYPLAEESLDVVTHGGTKADLSNLNAPENRFEPRGHKLLEVYQRVTAPDGSPLLFELYLRFGSVTASGGRIWRSFAPAFLGALLLLQLLQLPFALSLARRLRQRHQERETLLTRALHASDQERRRIARDLHDGAVQTLSGVAYALAGVNTRLTGDSYREERSVVRQAIADTRRGVAELRSLLVEIYPPSLQKAGLAAALNDLTSSLTSRGIAVALSVDPLLAAPVHSEAIVYRVVQEATRNIIKHAHAQNVTIHVWSESERLRASVADDGIGFDPDQVSTRGHLGLTMLAELVTETGGTLTVDSGVGRGATIALEAA